MNYSGKIIIVAVVVIAIVLAVTFWPVQNNTWHEENGFRWSGLRLPWFGKTGFAKLSETQTGVTFVNALEERNFKNNRILLNGSGVAIGDVDNDGLADLYFCGLSRTNVLYKNLGNWKFSDITAAAGVAAPEQFSTGAVFADIDGDRDLDLIVTAIGGPNACFLNDGAGRFTDATKAMGLMAETGAASMALADIDGDGDLDLYITNYKRTRAKDIYTPMELGFDNIVKKVGDTYQIAPKFRDHYRLEIRDNRILWFENGEPDRLFLNDGTGKFQRVSSDEFLDENGEPLPELRDFGLTVRFQDMDDDNDPDIYVCNDFDTPDRIWINNGNGRFKAIPKLAIRKTSNSSMAVDFSDIDRDGDLDIFVVDMLSRDHRKRMTQFQGMASSFTGIGEIDNRPEYVLNTLFLNRGDNTYAEIARFSGVQASEWSWSVQFLDVDLDGYEDILIPTGNFYDSQDLDTNEKITRQQRLGMLSPRDVVEMYPKLDLPNVAFHNRGDLTFVDVSDRWGFVEEDISHGMAVGDLDNDGDLDLVFNRLGKTAALFKNHSKSPRIAVRLEGRPPNTQAIGAKITVLGGPVPQTKEVIAGGTYLSHSDPVYSFATGDSDSLTIAVRWRDGSTTIVPAEPNRVYEIQQTPGSRPQDASLLQTAKPEPYFKDVSALLNHIHHEEPFDDFQRQPLLPNRLSQPGPGAAWFDIDDDGDDDLILPSGKGGQLTIFKNQQDRGFSKIQSAIPNKSLEHDQTSVVGWSRGDGQTSLFVAHSNFENTPPDSSFILKYDFKNGVLAKTSTLSLNSASPGPMSMADTDSDGDLDLFVGGRTIPARYPEPASSLLFTNDSGEFWLDPQNRLTLEKIGMISGAVFSDLDDDADPDLILAVEWGPIVVLRNQNGIFENVTSELGLADYLGLWNGVTVGDFNEDGRPDIIATNHGLNGMYPVNGDKPLKLYYNDFDNNGILDVIEAYFDPAMGVEVPILSLRDLQQSLPYLRMRISTHQRFAESSVARIIGPQLRQSGKVEANTFAHMLFINRENGFAAVPLPAEAQFAVASDVGVADFDGDGHEDVFLSQNFFASQPATPRSDAGRGLWLQGDGTGRLKPVSGQQSGVTVYGEQRGAALGDFNGDGKIDLVVTQNGAPTRLYQNVRAKPGLRVKLVGPDKNPDGIGAIIRIQYENGMGPAREVHAGSGYWSQDSAVQVMGLREKPQGVWVRWLGGEISSVAIRDNVGSVTIYHEKIASKQ